MKPYLAPKTTEQFPIAAKQQNESNGKEAEFTSPNIARLAAMNPQAIRYFYYLDDVEFTPQLEQPTIAIGLIRKLLPLLEP
jgi:hypothetical protein